MKKKITYKLPMTDGQRDGFKNAILSFKQTLESMHTISLEMYRYLNRDTASSSIVTKNLARGEVEKLLRKLEELQKMNLKEELRKLAD